MYIYMYVYTCVYIHVFVCMCVCVRVRVCACVCVCVYTGVLAWGFEHRDFLLSYLAQMQKVVRATAPTPDHWAQHVASATLDAGKKKMQKKNAYTETY